MLNKTLMKKMRKSTGMNTPRKRTRGKLPKKEMKSLNNIGQEWYPYEEEDGEASVLRGEDPEEGEEEPEEEQ